ncbi:MAG: amidohydrolase family protein [Sulfurifustaceae bacterium]
MMYNGATFSHAVHDADAHLVETPDWLHPYADSKVRARLRPIPVQRMTPDVPADIEIERWRQRHWDPREQPTAEREIMLRKGWAAMGSFIKEHRPRAVDLLGFSTQLVSTTLLAYYLFEAEHADDLDFAYGYAQAHNRGIADFCSLDKRLLAVGYVPLADFDRALATAKDAVRLGCKALRISQSCPRGHSPSHVGLDPLWAYAEEHGIPIVFHVRENKGIIDDAYYNNGSPPEHDFLGGGGENYTCVNHMAIPRDAMQTLATMIFDGVLDRFPRLKFGVLEMGASWVPGWMRYMDAAFEAFGKHERRLQRLSGRPSEIVRRQIRVTPYSTEDVSWIAAGVGDEVLMFSSDYPHVEGGRDPLKRFQNSTASMSATAKQRFYCDNYVDLMGPTLTA